MRIQHRKLACTFDNLSLIAHSSGVNLIFVIEKDEMTEDKFYESVRRETKASTTYKSLQIMNMVFNISTAAYMCAGATYSTKIAFVVYNTKQYLEWNLNDCTNIGEFMMLAVEAQKYEYQKGGHNMMEA